MEHKTIRQLFESQRDVLAQRLEGLKLPKDAQKAQAVVSSYLNELFDGDGEFRQSLTQSEDYILQAAMSMLDVHQSIAVELIDGHAQESDIHEQTHTQSSFQPHRHQNKCFRPTVLGGTAIGGAAGAFIMGSWGAVFGAIAGTALVLYASSQVDRIRTDVSNIQQTHQNGANAYSADINVDTFISIVGQICESIDNLIDTVRMQMQRLKNSYENRDKESFLSTYASLSSKLEDLIAMAKETDVEIEDLKLQVELVERSLKNYGVYFNNGKLLNK